MITVHEAVEEILYSDEEALYALSSGYMNLSAYASLITNAVEEKTKKQVGKSAVVVALSRIRDMTPRPDPLVVDVCINNITTKSPLSEIIFAKTPELLTKLSSLYTQVRTSPDDFLTMTLSTSEITVICSDRLREKVLSHFCAEPLLIESGLAAIGLSLDPKYYHMPNITFSLIRRIAQKRITLAETITTHTEIIFVFAQDRLPDILPLFRT